MKYYSICGNSFSKVFERGLIMENLVEVKNNQVVTSSRQVAKFFGKLHKNVLQTIENIKAENSAVTTWFYKTSYSAGTGKQYPEYYMNRDGFSLLVMGFTGQKAIEWKIKYIQAFNQMEEALRQKPTTPAPVLKRVTYKGQIMMQSVDLAQLTGLSNATLLTQAKKHKLCHILLNDDTLKVFKLENHLRTGASRVVLYPRDTVVSLLMLRNLYSKVKNVILDYFQVSSTAIDSQWFVAETATINTAIGSARKRLATLDGILEQFTQSRRSFQEHISLLEFANELSTFMLRDLYKLKEQVALLKP